MKYFSCILFFLLGLFLFPQIIFAQDASTAGITVHPAIVMLDLAVDQPQTTLSYTNNSSQTILLNFSSSDVTESGENYDLSFLDKKDTRNFTYGLSSWIDFSSSSLLLSPHTTENLTVFIHKDTLSPGGHYGSILAEVQQTSDTKNISLKTVIATLLFVRTNTGHEYETGSITTFSPEQTFYSFPQQFLLRFTNSGDTFLTPYGKVSIYDSFGHLIGNGIVNTGSLIVLPESLRRLEIPVHSFTTLVWPGMYHANLALHFGKTNTHKSETVTFFTLGSLPALSCIGAFLLAVVLLLLVVKKIIFHAKKSSSSEK